MSSSTGGGAGDGGGERPRRAETALRFSSQGMRASDCDVAFARAGSGRIELGFGVRGASAHCEGAVGVSLQHLLSLDPTAARNLEEVLARILGAPAPRQDR